jgi:hypothetical protein
MGKSVKESWWKVGPRRQLSGGESVGKSVTGDDFQQGRNRDKDETVTDKAETDGVSEL